MAGSSTALLFVQALETSANPAAESRRRSSFFGPQRAGGGKNNASVLRAEASRGQPGELVDARAVLPPLATATVVVPESVDHEQPWPRFMIHPLDVKKRCWDWFLMLLVVYSLVMVPWTVAFSMHDSCGSAQAIHDGCLPTAVKFLDIAVDACFWLDIVVNFRSGFLDDRREVHMEPRRVAKRYLSTWCLIDVLSVFPFKTVAATVIHESNDMTLQLFLLPKLLRIGRMFKKLSTWAAADLFRIVKLTVLFLLTGHWIGCLWFYIGRWQISHGSLNAFTGRQTWLQAFPGRGKAYLYADVRTQYTASLYWAVTTMTTVGYGDIVPLTNVERAFACCVELIGAIGTALVFGNVALLMQNSDGAAARYRQRLLAIKKFCARHGVPPSLAARIKSSVNYLWAAHAGLDAPAVVANLPLPLQAEVLSHVQQRVVHNASLFKHCDAGFINAVVVRLRPQVVLPGDEVFSVGDASADLFFISRGCVDITDGVHPASAFIAALREGEFFGEVEAFGARQRRCVTVTATTFCDLHVISKADLDDILLDFPEYVNTLRAAADQRLAELAARGAQVEGPAVVRHDGATALPATLQSATSEDGAASDGLSQAERLLDELIAWQAAQERALHHKLWALEEAHALLASKLAALAKQYTAAVEVKQSSGSLDAPGSTSGRLAAFVRSATTRLAHSTRRIKPVAVELTPTGTS